MMGRCVMAALFALLSYVTARVAYVDASPERCPHGSDGGVLITIRARSQRTEGGTAREKQSADYAEKLRAWQRDERRLLAELEHEAKVDRIQAFSLVPVIKAHLTPRVLQRVLEDDDEVVLVEADCVVVADEAAHTDSIQVSPPWGLDRVDSCYPACGSDSPRDLDANYHFGGATGNGSVVYVLDTGVRISHVDFGGRAVAGWSASCVRESDDDCVHNGGLWAYQGVITDVVNGNLTARGRSECSSHGTHCAGTVGGERYGVAKGVTLVAVQALSCAGSAPTAAIIASIEWAVEDAERHGRPSTLSMSLGGGRSSAENAAVAAAHAAGVSVVVAAGNDRSDACTKSPASAPEALTVGSIAQGDSMSSFSNYGRCVDLFAPGSGVQSACSSTDTASCSKSGTSMACPHVAGAAALLRSLHPEWSPDRVTEVLICMTTPNAVSGLLDVRHTPNKLLYTGTAATVERNIQCMFPPLSPSP